MDKEYLEAALGLVRQFHVVLRKHGRSDEVRLTGDAIDWPEVTLHIQCLDREEGDPWYKGEWIVGNEEIELMVNKNGEGEDDQGWEGRLVRSPARQEYYNRVLFSTFMDALKATTVFAEKNGCGIVSNLPKM